MRAVLNEIAKLSLLLQREDVALSSIMKKVQSVHLALSEMMDNPGRNLQRFQDELSGAVFKEHTLVASEVPTFASKNILLAKLCWWTEKLGSSPGR